MRYILGILQPQVACLKRAECRQVTIQIDTDPPKSGPSGVGTPSGSTASTSGDVNDLVDNMTKISKEFKIPVEVIE